ncbi:MAG: PQQ-like beta-propeller repeat protein [Pirellulales bacterium]|nr:PQQ-like beta-propeller repeat protein [Pirellulales bacterium]
MSTEHESAPESGEPPAARPRRRWLIPLLIVGLTAALMILNSQVALLPQYGRAGTVTLTRYLPSLGGILLLVWLLFTRQVLWSTKMGVLGALGILGLATWLAVRKVEVSGDNQLIVYFAWDRVPGELSKTPSASGEAFPLDPSAPSCPGFLGSKRDSEVPGPKLETDWQAHPPRELWRREAGLGYAAFSTAQGLAVAIEQRGEDEVTFACELRTGSEIWQRTHQAFFQESLGGDGPRATPTIDDDRVYTLGATGNLACLQLADGKQLWEVDILADNGAKNITWGMSGSPLIDGDRVWVNPGGASGHAVAAYDKRTGQRVAAGGDGAAAYCSPQLSRVAGTEQIVLLDGPGLAGFDRQTAQELWRYPFETFQNINVAQPLLVGENRVLISAGYGHGAALVEVANSGGVWKATEVWKSKALECKFCSPVLVGQHVYGLDDGILACMDATTGKRVWKGGRYGHGQMLRRDDLLIIQAEAGDVVLVRINPQKLEELGRFTALSGPKNWNAPALAGNLLLVRNHLEMACFELPLAAAP